ncbi:MAG: sigma-54-dependent transcriptional regulator, partial [Desulfovibrionaceae bacterium]
MEHDGLIPPGATDPELEPSLDGRRILVVDDEQITRENLAYVLGKEGYEVRTVDSGAAAVEALREEAWDLVLTDLRLGAVDGMEVLGQARALQPDAEVIMFTGYATVATAVEAMKLGAYHYLPKPFKIDELRVLARKALEKGALRREVRELRARVSAAAGTARIVGQHPKMLALKETIAQIAQLDCNVLIQGETGTGKELVARVIHELSPRAGKRFLAINCGAFTEELMTSELFGYERGAFTGAARSKPGLLEAAEGGTLLLDEIGEMPLSLQVKLLRVLQERVFMRVGGTEEIPVDIRVLAATNKNLKAEAEQGLFRQDLYYRLNVISLEVPPLAARREDIGLLAQRFLVGGAKGGYGGAKGQPHRLSAEALEVLMAYEFPGNVRELQN